MQFSTQFLKGNLGNGNFTPGKKHNNYHRIRTLVHAGDLDGEGDLDVLSASFCPDKIVWYKNL